MTAVMLEEAQTANDLKDRLKKTWMTGDYDLFSRYMQQGSEDFFRRLPVAPGMRVLDVGCGSGQLALMAARAGARVTGCDIATNWLEKARSRAAAEGLDITFDAGDAESLPYDDGEFDVVMSMVGAMFAPRPEMVSAELARVCRKGGTIAMANWTPGGFIGQMFGLIASHIGPSGMPSPVLWGDPGTVRERFGETVVDLRMTSRMFPFEYPFGPEDVVDFYRTNYGPASRAFDSLSRIGQEELRRELVRLWATSNLSTGCYSTAVDAEYLEVIATRV